MKRKTIEMVFRVSVDIDNLEIAKQIAQDDKTLINYIGSSPLSFLSYHEQDVVDCAVSIFNPTSDPPQTEEDLIPDQLSAIQVTWQLEQGNLTKFYGTSIHSDAEAMQDFKKKNMPHATDDCVQPTQKIPIREEMITIKDEEYIKELLSRRTIFYPANK